jgi:pSer/pThr/pTyr-binding forkhead associated (FHA) protein
MVKSLDYRELAIKALAGALGAFIGSLLVEPAAQSLSFLEPHQDFGGIVLALCIFAGLVGGLVNTPFGHCGAKSAFWQFLRTFLLCAFLLSLLAQAFAAVTFDGLVFPQANSDIDAYGCVPNYLLPVGSWYQTHNVSLSYIFLARLCAYTIFGGILGLSVGLTSFSPANLLKGAVGGGLGGFAGALFWTMGGDGMIARMCSLTATGFGIGLFVGLVNELTKVAWLTVEGGRLKGRQFRCDRSVVNLGKAEQNEVGLFGDHGVVARHACIERNGQEFVLKDLSRREGTYLNGAGIDRESLQDGDLIQIGSYGLRFHSRLMPAGYRSVARRMERPGAARPIVSRSTASLTDLAGNHIVLPEGRATRLGRAHDNDVILADNRASQYHATITAASGRFFIRDLGSTNGTFVDGARVIERALSDGNQIKLGDTCFTFLYRSR